MARSRKAYNGWKDGDQLSRLAFPMGGIGAGMICIEGSGALSHVSLRNKPDVLNEPLLFSALHVKGAGIARVLEGPVPMWKAFGRPGAGLGSAGRSYGLPRFGKASFLPQFPFGTVGLQQKDMPVDVELTGWSPFVPNDADSSSLPVCAVEYRFRNRTDEPVECVYSFHAENFLGRQFASNEGRPIKGGFVLGERPWFKLSGFARECRYSKVASDISSVAEAPPVRMDDNLDWKTVHADSAGFINLHDTVAGKGIVYFGTRIHVEAPGKVVVLLGHDGGAKLFVDGQAEACAESCMNPAIRDRTRAEVELAAGEHEIVTAFDLADGKGYGIFLRFALPASQAGDPRAALPRFPALPPGDDLSAGNFAAFVDGKASVDCAAFQGGWHDSLTLIWNAISSGQVLSRPPCASIGEGRGASLYQPFRIAPGSEHTVRLMLAWYVPDSPLRFGPPLPDSGCCRDGACSPETYQPWYAGRFGSVEEVTEFWKTNYATLLEKTRRFSECFYDSTLPPEAIEAVAANLTILKSPTALRQKDGRFWGWEGCQDGAGICAGSCTHVWNYAQAMPHLFPALERTLRETEFLVSQDERGHQNFRSALPIRPTQHGFHAAADGQLGGIVKLYREWRIGGDTAWMKRLWPRARASLTYCIETWDPDREGWLVEPHHNTYDIEFWGPDGMCTSFYLAALAAAVEMGCAAGDDTKPFETLLGRGRKRMEKELWNGSYFIQQVRWEQLKSADDRNRMGAGCHTDDVAVVIRKEGPKYQFGTGCISDGVMGDWLARVSGAPTPLSPRKVKSHITSVFRNNFRSDLSDHANPQRPGYALGKEAGLLLCSWPDGGKPLFPFVYSDEVWTGIEYQVASHLIMMGRVREGLRIVRAVRDRYDGRYRNPFDEYECGHWYARAMSSYALLQALSGARYDAVEQVLHLAPAVQGDFRCFLCTATGYGTVGVRNGQAFLDVVEGSIPIRRMEYRNPEQQRNGAKTRDRK